jgi:hypothetical protein
LDAAAVILDDRKKRGSTDYPPILADKIGLPLQNQKVFL